MFLTIHAAAGMLIGEHVKTPLAAFLLGLFSHFLLDAIPHGDESLAKGSDGEKNRTFYYIGFTDILIAAAFIIGFYGRMNPLNFKIIVWTLCGAMLPDFICCFYDLFKFRLFEGFNNLHHSVHRLNKAPIRPSIGLAFQFTIFVFIAALLFSS